MSVRSRQARNNPYCEVVMPVPVSANILCYVRPPIPFHCLYQMHPYAQQQQQQQMPQLSENDMSILSIQENDKDYHLPPSQPIVEYSDNITILTGNIVLNTLETVPEGYLLCDGSEISRNTYSDLFKAVGTFYGVGDKKDTFSLPNLQDDKNISHYMIKI
jgi:hypothetical protein